MESLIQERREGLEQSAEAVKGPIIALIPAYNEERFIGSLVLMTLEHVDQVIVIDDGSRDRTAEVAAKAGATVVKHLVNQGKAAGVNTGFIAVRSLDPTAVVMLDGDGQHSSDDIPAVLAPILQNEADIVVGSRFLSVKSDIPAYRQVGQHGLTMATNLASGVRVTDSQSGFRAFSGAAIAQLSFGQGGFSIESEMQFKVREHKLRVVEVPIKVTYAEPAKRNPVKHGMQVIDGIMRLVALVRPLLYFGGSGLAFLLSGLALGLYVVNVFTRLQQLATGYALLTVLLCLIGILLLFAGVILHAMRAMLVDVRESLANRLGGLTEHSAAPRGRENRTVDLGAGARGKVRTYRPART
ncbi:MAG: glycosyltransferase family 2 protein [Pseudomonadota bacterium]|nr:glycosyltransferase family 2 protein [Pseudomonadota bacterium]PLS76928.1 MAG: glycosyltransferase family 2 protein [Chloroflexota bacterium]